MKIPYGRQHITQADIEAVTTALKADFLTTGPTVDEFEEKFAKYVGSKYAIAVANGTAALHLSTLALEVDETSKVITTPITFAASANCVRYCNGTVVFADIDPSTLLLDLQKVKEKLESAPKGTYSGIIPVDFAGYPVNLEAYRKLADEHGLWILEDACHAPGGYFIDSNGNKQNCGNGNFADLAIFSFHPVKHIACGEGGMITTNRKDLYEKLKILRTHGITRKAELLSENHGGWYYEMVSLGYNYRIPDILCALGISQLSRVEEGMKRRRAIAQKYNDAFANTAVETIKVDDNIGHAYHLYVIKVKNRKAVYDALRQKGIFAQIHYIPVHTLPYYRNINKEHLSYPLAESYYEQCISLPMFPSLKDEEQDYVIENVLNLVSESVVFG